MDANNLTYVDIGIIVFCSLAVLFVLMNDNFKRDNRVIGPTANLVKSTNYIFGITMLGYFASGTVHAYKPVCAENQTADYMTLCLERQEDKYLSKEEYDEHLRSRNIPVD